ncbi:MAG: OsmC family protein [Deltaproteobacteria bacterium]|nr:OsmC family protein [Deltaproteobacteria bacterium]MBW2017434.1 OsmC family protein [Deltaproteobacteria bacterium]MBW2129586.1 OsmC family protein [Deltaproteobacteria bacterium]MBW2303422.1 OsmC family protein [Deltaproteobacteria bacterium]
MIEMNKEKDSEIQPELEGYKKKILPVNKSRLRLERDLYFIGMTQRGYEVEYDVKYEEGCSPTETLLLSIAGCISIDVVHILRKMRCEVSKYEVEASGTRRPDPPQYYTSVDLMIHISGKGITPSKIDRAIALSLDKYCSVYHSLRKDLKVNIEYQIES